MIFEPYHRVIQFSINIECSISTLQIVNFLSVVNNVHIAQTRPKEIEIAKNQAAPSMIELHVLHPAPQSHFKSLGDVKEGIQK